MQHGRNSQCLAYSLQAFSGHVCCLREEQAGLGTGLGIAARCEYKHIVLDELFYHVDVAIIMNNLGIVAADNSSNAPNSAALDGSNKRI